MPGRDAASVAVIVFAHGSSVEQANHAVARLAEEVSRRTGWWACCAFLEAAEPDLATAVARCLRQGAEQIVVVPYFLTPGVHVQEDLPRLLQQQRRLFPAARIRVAGSLDGHPGMVDVILAQAREALGQEAE